MSLCFGYSNLYASHKKKKKQEKINPEKLAYDRPSPKLLGFLAKHYGLKGFSPQANNFVVFDKYFQGICASFYSHVKEPERLQQSASLGTLPRPNSGLKKSRPMTQG